ncbi:MAG: DUF4249 domain-containing protein [Rhodothermaceae bacterium]|nr:DUF4249 domain-containing protein [Rhodothermaceae bacterium]
MLLRYDAFFNPPLAMPRPASPFDESFFDESFDENAPTLTPRMAIGLLLLTLLLTVLGGCETVVDVNVPPHERQLVAQGFFAPESLWTVRVSHTVGYSEPTVPGLVEDAAVEIWEGDQLLERLARRDSGTYIALGSRPELGRLYSLRVSAPGYETVEGGGALPSPPQITAFEPALVSAPSETRRIVRLRLILDDLAGETNYYTLAVLHLRALVDLQAGSVTSLPPALFPFTSDNPSLGNPLPNPLDPDSPTYYQALLRDDRFDGQAHTLDVEIAYDVASPPSPGPTVQRAFVVLFAALSEDLYRYAKTAPEQALFGENPFAEPLRVYSNLSNGFGLFAGFSPRAFPVPPDSLLPVVP